MANEDMLTDEELAELSALVAMFPEHHILPVAQQRLARLITALRASRAEVDRLQADSNRFRAEAERLSRLRVSKESLIHKVKNLEAEVEGLKEVINGHSCGCTDRAYREFYGL